MNFKPLYDKILVKRDEPKTTTPSGIILPESTREKIKTGTVVAVGEGTKVAGIGLMPLNVAVGNRIMFSSLSGVDVSIDGQTYVLMKEEDVYGIL